MLLDDLRYRLDQEVCLVDSKIETTEYIYYTLSNVSWFILTPNVRGYRIKLTSDYHTQCRTLIARESIDRDQLLELYDERDSELLFRKQYSIKFE
jgi:hypothetical protein